MSTDKRTPTRIWRSVRGSVRERWAQISSCISHISWFAHHSRLLIFFVFHTHAHTH